ncbi:hypothetical protein ERO13_D10G192100v2 [Gossypium hirsutum]|uniref:Uncharacterized protein LOC107915143 n=3 Tax=Gossypium TaxID=3633 RepID=A0A1U8KB99_GOSHI|nr:uncharacterized protein LOC107915143 [Gossypium hirsutum]XP_016699781.1 uncharacterized protein LOC107915143 [Gossypium hirsutum]XP_016699783.1 uncharacterized protein LOC107915143 [Gossypium hirsutum]XP_016699784.1 uncharacterized protein LOC107915143 [Gossypium hirsutum]TYH50833.1 hypothetical protein ES332_D10G232800v1 [Gossypium tomentosum]TYI62063.1 hypothetical protein E1A91_D10G218900v1 [Gossypium mustelinum]KAG4127013.1 hypothetical protein ERO13_D10G192100v2 [Gossypium hirsutum]K
MDMKKMVQITLYNQEKEEKRILLKLNRVGCGDEADQYCYSISQSIPLRDLMLDFIKRVGVTFNSVRFYYEDKPINPAFNAIWLNMKDGDTIAVSRRRNFRPTAATQSTLITLPLAVVGEKPVVLKVKHFRADGALYYYLIGRNTPMKNLLHDYADRINELYEQVNLSCFRFCSIDMGKTADDLGLEDGDVIYAFLFAMRAC